jgi:hypothetical protein
MFRQVPLRLGLGQPVAAPPPMPRMPVTSDHEELALVPAKKWLLNFAILAAGVGIGFMGIKHHKEPLGILAIQAGGSVAGAALVLLALDIGYPEGATSGAAT